MKKNKTKTHSTSSMTREIHPQTGQSYSVPTRLDSETQRLKSLANRLDQMRTFTVVRGDKSISVQALTAAEASRTVDIHTGLLAVPYDEKSFRDVQ